MNKSLTKKIITGTIIALAAILLMQLIYHVHVYLEKKSNHDKVVRLVDQDLMFRWDTMDSDLEYINNWISTDYFENEDLGRLYERASLIYMQKGEIMPYYRYLGYAIYYLERSPEKDYTVNVYLDLANFFLNNYAEESAKKMIDSARRIEDFDDIDSLQVKSYAFRMLGIEAILDNDYAMAEEYLNKAQETVAMSHTGIFEECYEAINDIWLARAYAESGRFDECHAKLEKWEGHPMFYTDIYREILLRDLIIPYHQAKFICLTAELQYNSEKYSPKEMTSREKVLADSYEEFMRICEENGYKKAELFTLIWLQNEYPPENEKAKEQLFNNLQRLYTELLDEQNITYANVIDSTVLNSISEIDKDETVKSRTINKRRLTAITIIAVAIIIVTMVIAILNSRVDGLTGLLNRKTLDRAIVLAKKSNQTYGVIMFDIDHFKHINDNYGHQNGDIVLERMGHLILSVISTESNCFRYGGEEFVILLPHKSVPYAEAIAERIRKSMEQQTWPFGEQLVITVSGGVASGSGETDVLKKADENLYHSKEGGRNRETVTE